MNSPAFTPVLLLTGFLGSGKTTLLARLIDDGSSSDVAVLINEFGEVALDHRLVGQIDDTTIVLKSGCLCCTLNGDLADAVEKLHGRRARGEIPFFRRLVIETTGLADPSPILATFRNHPVLRHHFEVVSVVATLDAVLGAETLRRHAESRKQVAVADWLLISKTDIASREAQDAVTAAARGNNPAAEIVSSRDIEPARLFEPWWPRHMSRAFSCTETTPASEHPHLDSIRTTAVHLAEDSDWSTFGLWLTALLHARGHEILRVKAILDLSGVEGKVVVHGVQNIVHPPVHLAESGTDLPASQAVFIHHGDLGSAIIRSLKAFGIKVNESTSRS